MTTENKHISPEQLIANPNLHRPFLNALFDTSTLTEKIFIDTTGRDKQSVPEEMAKAAQRYLTEGLYEDPKNAEKLDTKALTQYKIGRILENPVGISTVVTRLMDTRSLAEKLAMERRADAMALDATTIASRLPEYLLPRLASQQN